MKKKRSKTVGSPIQLRLYKDMAVLPWGPMQKYGDGYKSCFIYKPKLKQTHKQNKGTNNIKHDNAVC